MITPETYNRIICVYAFEVYLTPETFTKVPLGSDNFPLRFFRHQ